MNEKINIVTKIVWKDFPYNRLSIEKKKKIQKEKKEL